MHSLSKKCTSNFTNIDTNLFGTKFECTPYQKKCALNFTSIDNDLFWTSFACTSYQKIHLKFNMYRHRISAAERLTTASSPQHAITFLFELVIPFPSILLVYILSYSSIGFYPFHSFSSIPFF